MIDLVLFSDAASDLDTRAARLGCAFFVFTGIAQNSGNITIEHEVFEQPPEGEWLNIAMFAVGTAADDVLDADAKAASIAWSLLERILPPSSQFFFHLVFSCWGQSFGLTCGRSTHRWETSA